MFKYIKSEILVTLYYYFQFTICWIWLSLNLLVHTVLHISLSKRISNGAALGQMISSDLHRLYSSKRRYFVLDPSGQGSLCINPYCWIEILDEPAAHLDFEPHLELWWRPLSCKSFISSHEQWRTHVYLATEYLSQLVSVIPFAMCSSPSWRTDYLLAG